MTENEIIRCLTYTRFPPRRYAVCPNVTALLPWEADLLAVSRTGRRHEVEAKSTAQDLWRDLKKRKWKFGGPWEYVDFFWYAVPRHLAADAMEIARGNGAGVLIVSEPKDIYHTEEALKARRSQGVKSDAVTAEAVYRLASLRFWDSFNKQEVQRVDDQQGQGEAGRGGDSYGAVDQGQREDHRPQIL